MTGQVFMQYIGQNVMTYHISTYI